MYRAPHPDRTGHHRGELPGQHLGFAGIDQHALHAAGAEDAEQVDQRANRKDVRQAVFALCGEAPGLVSAVPGEVDEPRFLIEQGLPDVVRLHRQSHSELEIIPVLAGLGDVLNLTYLAADPEGF